MKKILTFVFLILMITTFAGCTAIPTSDILVQDVETLKIGEKTLVTLYTG